MSGTGDAVGDGTYVHRMCARRGCNAPVKKRTAKYCSVRCCAIDPERRERIRVQSRRAHGRTLVMAKQLTFTLDASSFDPEALLAQMSAMREDVPAGMSRLAG